jgi:hypothetical protein
VDAATAAYERIVARGVKLVLLTGDLPKALTNRKKFHGSFDLMTIGCRHMHMAGAIGKIDQVSKEQLTF